MPLESVILVPNEWLIPASNNLEDGYMLPPLSWAAVLQLPWSLYWSHWQCCVHQTTSTTGTVGACDPWTLRPSWYCIFSAISWSKCVFASQGLPPVRWSISREYPFQTGLLFLLMEKQVVSRSWSIRECKFPRPFHSPPGLSFEATPLQECCVCQLRGLL